MAARRGVFWATLLVVAGVLLAVGVSAWGVVAYTAQPSFCASCHVMQTRFASWQRSPHAGRATCIECHAEPGAWGELKAHLNGTRYLYVMLTGEKSGPILRAEVAVQTCLACHPREGLAESTRVHEIRHRAHLARGFDCTACHAGLVHGSLSGDGARPAMERCAECHERQGAVSVGQCSACHRPVPGSPLVGRLRS